MFTYIIVYELTNAVFNPCVILLSFFPLCSLDFNSKTSLKKYRKVFLPSDTGIPSYADGNSWSWAFKLKLLGWWEYLLSDSALKFSLNGTDLCLDLTLIIPTSIEYPIKPAFCNIFEKIVSIYILL